MITYEEFVAAAREVVAERPDFIYASPHRWLSPDDPTPRWSLKAPAPLKGTCKYVKKDDPTEPDCLIGCIMKRLGLPLPAFDCGEAAYYVLRELVEDRGRDFAIRLQRRQDIGTPWGEALDQTLRERGEQIS